VIADDLFDDRAGFVIWGGVVGENACTYGQAKVNWFARSECYDFVTDFDIDSSTRVVAKTELDQLRFAEHRMDRRGDAGRSSIDCWSRKERRNDYCDDGEAIVLFHTELPVLLNYDGELSAMVQEARRGLSYVD
jgi:hypothetical protein